MVVYFVLLATYTYSIDRNGGLAGSIDFARGGEQSRNPRKQVTAFRDQLCVSLGLLGPSSASPRSYLQMMTTDGNARYSLQSDSRADNPVAGGLRVVTERVLGPRGRLLSSLFGVCPTRRHLALTSSDHLLVFAGKA